MFAKRFQGRAQPKKMFCHLTSPPEADLATEREREASTAGFSSRVQQNISQRNKSVSVEIAAISGFACQDEVDLHRVQLFTQINSVY